MEKFEVVRKEEDLIYFINLLAEDLKRRAEDISVDWNKHISKIEIKSTIEVGALIQWKISKIYNVPSNIPKEIENEESN